MVGSGILQHYGRLGVSYYCIECLVCRGSNRLLKHTYVLLVWCIRVNLWATFDLDIEYLIVRFWHVR